MELVFSSIRNFRSLDYVTSWFWKGANYITNSNAKLAFVATNSICQGEQVSSLWKPIFSLNLNINFAYQSFPWSNNARNNTTVYTIIVGLSYSKEDKKLIFTEINENLIKKKVSNISPYLIEGKNLFIENRLQPLCKISKILLSNVPRDNGFLFLSEKEKIEIINEYPELSKYIRDIIGGEEFLNSTKRLCLWLKDANLPTIEKSSFIKERLDKIREFRASSSRMSTQRQAVTPHLFSEIRQPESGQYILIPSPSSERRKYIPIGFINNDIISINSFIIPNATLYEFGIITSEIHNDFLRIVTGRLENRLRYSAKIVYNNFPFPEVTEEQKKQISELAEEVLLVRDDFPDMTLAQLYNPETMPESLKQAHKTLDKAVERLYRDKPFADSSERVAFLFQRYEALIKA